MVKVDLDLARERHRNWRRIGHKLATPREAKASPRPNTCVRIPDAEGRRGGEKRRGNRPLWLLADDLRHKAQRALSAEQPNPIGAWPELPGHGRTNVDVVGGGLGCVCVCPSC